jgi:hypothetical protein
MEAIMKSKEELEEAKLETQKHIILVRQFADILANTLVHRCEKHDASKLEQPELEGFSGYTKKLNGCSYGSTEEVAYREELKEIRKHHHAINRHHPEYHEIGVGGMNIIDLLEMFVDWKAASMRHAGYSDFPEGVALNCERFNVSPQLARIFMNSLDIFET